MGGGIQVYVTTHPLKGLWVVFSLGTLRIKLLGTFVYRFCMTLSFYFAGIRAELCNRLVVW